MKDGRIFLSIGMVGVVVGLLIVSVVSFIYRADYVTGIAVAEEVKKLSVIFEKINKSCGIASFDRQQNIINFLNVEKFAGSEVGSMNLNYPDKWEGPYVANNPSIQGKEYMVIKTEDGYFITPGNGVKLPNGAEIGKDIVLNSYANIPAMIADKRKLHFRGRPLAAKINLKKDAGISDAWRMKN